MSPRTISESVLRNVEPLAVGDTVETAVRRLLELDLPALPAVDGEGHYAGIFGEREFLSALFPGYLRELKGSAFLSRGIDDALEKRETCRAEAIERYLTTDHVEVDDNFSDAELAEIFFHHRVLIIPVLQAGRVNGIVTRHDFFRAVAARFVDRP
jgi:CBS domain-containing protein